MKGRFAPSPSGYMHIGNVFSALMAWLSIRSQNGTMLLRIEDLDRQRCKDKKHTEQLMEDLKWLGLDWDEGGEPSYYQSNRTAYYESILNCLEETGHTYPCFCSRKDLAQAANAPHQGEYFIYPGTCKELTKEQIAEKSRIRRPNIRLRVPEKTICFTDGVYGLVQQNLAKECGDFVLKRGGDDQFSYQLAVVADDIDMGITQIVRGNDLLQSTPRQIYLYELLGTRVPQYAHVPLLKDETGRRLSKRNGDLSIASLRENGIPSQRIIGMLAALVGLCPAETEVTPKDLIPCFSLKKIEKKDYVLDESWIHVLFR